MQEMVDYIKTALDGKFDKIEQSYGEVSIVAFPDTVIEVLRTLRDDVQLQFVNFIDLCGVDYPERKKRFDVVYHLLSPYRNKRIRIKVATDAETPLPSSIGIFAGADWFEREAYDLYGILFTGHPDLRRLLTDYGFEGHPLRKDFPLTGYSEVRYDDVQKRVVYEPIRLRQEFRDFDFLSPWEGTDYEIPNELIGDEKASKDPASKDGK